MTDPHPVFNPSPSRESLTRLMRLFGHNGVLRVRTSRGSDAALNLLRPEGKAMTPAAPMPTSKEIQITGIRKHVAECVTEINGARCGARSNVWDTPVHLNVWILAHADAYAHKKFVKHTEDPVNVYTKPAKRPQ
ncbi:hypothetical protein ADK86_28725 [Streptomyces sp. NRRL F-5755]|uniref:DUF7848 domain-containing protein n=1 Tax=Streptomyces sp. NRRL F-5755 TaxID=1519475 RepID=UPI0006AF0EF5|nr:hypothetical protein [Streptomyces sp. NRRL F-5755]KOT89481.1 hypothetical protein ADK86_28725 [Streptomyces sp. NRRL F-5755]